jgi:hypothetical protein
MVMVSGSARTVLLVGIVIGAAIVGGIIGAAADFALGTQGWWGAGILGGLMIASLVVARLVEGIAA